MTNEGRSDLEAQPGEQSAAGASGERTCFVIGPVGGERTEIRDHADRLFRHVIEPAAHAAGLKNAIRADHISSSGVITNEILNLLIEADAVVADLSYHNANAFYELAYRHIVRRPFAHVIRAGDAVPFDVGTSRAIRFDPNDWDSAIAARERLAETLQVELAKSQDEIETPFSVALDLRALATSQDPDEQPLAEIARAIQRLDGKISRIAPRAQARPPAPRAPRRPVPMSPAAQRKWLRDELATVEERLNGFSDEDDAAEIQAFEDRRNEILSVLGDRVDPDDLPF